MRRLFLAALCLAVALPASAQDLVVPSFVAESAGVTRSYEGDWEYMVGGGVATFDCNGDRLPDMFAAGGAEPAAFHVNRSAIGGDLRLERTESGLELDAVSGAYPFDVDSDGNVDLVLLRVGENVVMRGLGNCRFERANEAWGFDGGDAWSTAFAATWEEGADWPTLAIGNYIDRKEEGFPWGSCTDNWLHRPRGDRQGFAEPVALTPSYCALSMLFTDWNRSGQPSLRVSNDREYYKGGQEQLWHVEAGQEPRLYTQDEGWKPLRIWGMGIAGHDLDGDRYPEYFLTSMADNKLQTLIEVPADGDPAPDYRDVAFAKGVTAHRPYVGETVKPSTAWHAQFDDVNNDGRADLYVVKGNVAKMPDFAEADPNNLLVQRSDGTFEETGDRAGVASTEIGRGGQLVDLNLDGLLDMVAVNRWAAAEVWRNTTAGAGGWVQLALSQDGANRDAIGAWIEVRLGDRIVRREITAGGGHASGHLGWWHVGLGDAAEVEMRVTWPDGTESPWHRVKADAFYEMRRGAEPVAWAPPR